MGKRKTNKEKLRYAEARLEVLKWDLRHNECEMQEAEAEIEELKPKIARMEKRIRKLRKSV